MKRLRKAMKKYILTSILLGIGYVVFGQSNIIINPNGGKRSELDDGLKVLIKPNGTIHVYRENKTQYYSGYTWVNDGSGTSDGSAVQIRFRFQIGNTYNSAVKEFIVCNTTEAIQDGNDWKASISGYVVSSFDEVRFYVTMMFSYTSPNNYFAVDYIVRAPLTMKSAPQILHIYLDHDAYILGNDFSFGYHNVDATGEFIGNYRIADSCKCGTRNKNPRCPAHHGFKTDGDGFRSYFQGLYSSRTTVASDLRLLDTIYNYCEDDGVAAEFVTTPLSAGDYFVKRVLHCYGNQTGEFDTLPVNTPDISQIVDLSDASSAVMVNFTADTFTIIEGNTHHVDSSIQIVVSGGVLMSPQVATIMITEITNTPNPGYSYFAGFTIPAGDYNTPQIFPLTNITILGDVICNYHRKFRISMGNSNCNDLVLQGNGITQAVVNLIDDDEGSIPTVNQPPNIEICARTEFTKMSFSGNNVQTYNWTATNALDIGLPSVSKTGVTEFSKFTTANASDTIIISTITVTPVSERCTGEPKTFTISVKPKPIVAIAGTKLDTICLGMTAQLTPVKGGHWRSTNPAVATVTDSGLVTGITTGKARFIFTPLVGGCIDSTKILTVDTFPAINPVITADKDVICINETIELNSSQSDGVWKISNSNVLTSNDIKTDNPINVKGNKAGKTFISYTVGTGTCKSTTTFLLNVRPNTPPKILIDFGS